MADMPPELSGEPDPIPATGVEQDDINAQAILIVGAISVVLTLVAILGTSVLYYYVLGQETQAKVNAVAYEDAEGAVLQQRQQINRWDEAGGKFVIPIDVAMKLVVAELKEEPSASKAPEEGKDAQAPADADKDTTPTQASDVEKPASQSSNDANS